MPSRRVDWSNALQMSSSGLETITNLWLSLQQFEGPFGQPGTQTTNMWTQFSYPVLISTSSSVNFFNQQIDILHSSEFSAGSNLSQSNVVFFPDAPISIHDDLLHKRPLIQIRTGRFMGTTRERAEQESIILKASIWATSNLTAPPFPHSSFKKSHSFPPSSFWCPHVGTCE